MPPCSSVKRLSADHHTEAVIQGRIRLALGLEPDLVLWRNALGVARELAHDGSVRTRRHGLPRGSADLIGILAPSGRMVALEIKVPGWRPVRETDRARFAEQLRFLDLVRSQGGFGAVVHSVEEAVAAMARARRGERE